jgi:hypothetical protein
MQRKMALQLEKENTINIHRQGILGEQHNTAERAVTVSKKS